MAEFVQRPSPLALPKLDALCAELLCSPLVGKSTLGGSFRHSRGFALTFTQEGLPEVRQRFEVIVPFLELALAPESRLWSLGDRLRRRPPPVTRAFYVNLLMVGEGGGVGRHTDATLRGPSGDPEAVPQRVSVLYLDVPKLRRGGELRLFRRGRLVGRVQPRKGWLVHFRGDLQHEVTPLEGVLPGALRTSLVCEQYALASNHLARLPPVHVQSRAGFEAFLAHHLQHRH